MLHWLIRFIPQKVFKFGEGHVTRYTLFECKWLGSIYVHHLATEAQDRFHTHAFNSVSCILHGGYTEVVKHGFGREAPLSYHAYMSPVIRYIPRLLNHKLLQSKPHTVSLIFTGPYAELWTEETDDGVFRLITSGQKEVIRIQQ
jgi:hypothetical protein